MNTPIAILSPDDRGRFPLRRYLPAPTPTHWHLRLENDGKRIVLEAIEEAS